jgi:hypothetical protein
MDSGGNAHDKFCGVGEAAPDPRLCRCDAIARIRAEERESRDAAWTALLAASRLAVLEHTAEVLIGTHTIGACIGESCPLHRRSSHSMRRFPQAWREDLGLVERICTHGIGHPDPDDPKAYDPRLRVLHGCDGCCA